MANNRAFNRRYSLNIARLKNGQNEETYLLDQAFFDHFEYALAKEGEISVRLEMVKYNTHIHAHFNLEGMITLACDRCGEDYPQSVDARHRIIYSFDKKMNFEEVEVIYVDSQEDQLKLLQELYDFVQLSIPIRKVPSPEVHLCSPEVLELLNLDENGNPKEEDEDSGDEVTDPRWEALKKLKDDLN